MAIRFLRNIKTIDKNELRRAIEYALDFSHCDQFIIEDFIEKKGCSSDTDSFSIDGKLVATTFSSQRFDVQSDNPYCKSKTLILYYTFSFTHNS